MAQTPTDPGTATPRALKRATTVSGGTRIIGTYEIDKLISAGGMGEVYRGHNIHNGEPVAIKIVLPSLAHDPKIVALFQKESTTLSRLSHEAIVRYHVFTNDPVIGRPCLVMEFVAGTPVSERIETGPMPLDEVKVMLRRVASGLEKAHRAGVVHRDMSPDNIILEEGLVEHAKLIDFGIAKSSALGAGTLLQGQFAGKFNWVAPEQLGAFGGHVDGRSDIYSLALVAAAASKGAVLPMGDSIVDAVGKRAVVPDLTGVDARLVPLLGWMLSPDPAARPETMAQVIAALDNPALIPMLPDPNKTQIGGSLPHAAASATQDASPFGAAASPAPSRTEAAAPAKTSLILPIAMALILAAGAMAYFSGAFAPKPVQITAAPAPSVAATAKAAPAEQPALVEPTQAAPAPLPVTDLTDLLAQSQDCGPLSLTNPAAAGYAEADLVQISGHVASVAALTALKTSLVALTGKRPLQLEIKPLNPAICAVLNALPPLGSGNVTVALGYGDSADPNPEGRYVTGQNPVIDLTVPQGAGYVSVAVLDGSGQVLQLLPGVSQPDPGKLRVAFSVAESGIGRPALVVNPAGLGLVMILVLRSEAALEAGPMIEPADAFVARVKRTKLISMDQRLLNLTAP
ncbi:serine/threonine-protein kinase [Cypionkella sp.]|uniref:serine/threonine protein kinase n=1 Tax=Cypionkella sp. TaxID=2811411 RepID=UPI0027248421|nr:serine/threonine-protein kinase [Cypionkella sp.]MDO8982472.1 protein kinase [Cypionkella sp.]MDP1576230.1 protein kinase [Cypionkella sp.]MDP2050475.1 protein kinase [Cypionkella sp.]